MTGQTHPSGTDRVAEAALKLGLKDHDLVMNVQGDQPTFDPSCIPDLLKPFQEGSDIPMSTLMIRMSEKEEIENPNNVKVVTDREGFALYFSRAPIPFYRDTRRKPRRLQASRILRLSCSLPESVRKSFPGAARVRRKTGTAQSP